KLEGGSHRRQLAQKRTQDFRVLLEIWRELKQDRAATFAEIRGDLAEGSQRVLAISQLGEVRDFLRRLQRETKVFRRLCLPVFDRLERRNAMKGVIDFRGAQAFCKVGQHFACWQIFGVKSAFPLGVLETGGPDPGFHFAKVCADPALSTTSFTR